MGSGVATQISVIYADLRFSDQYQEPLAILSDHFKNEKIRWLTLWKNAYTIIATMKRMYWLLAAKRRSDYFHQR